MTDEQLAKAARDHLPVRVEGGDYAYEGWLACVFLKRSGAVRCVVEDDNGRLFIHRPEQVKHP